MLIDFNADLEARDIEGWTPLHAASATGNLQMLNLLLESGAPLTITNNDDHMPIDVAADSGIKHVLKQKMLEAGVMVIFGICTCTHSINVESTGIFAIRWTKKLEACVNTVKLIY